MYNKSIIVVNEKWYESWAKDLFTYAGIAVTTYLNEFYLGGNNLVGLVLVMMMVALIIGNLTKSGMEVMTDNEVIDYLSKKHNIKMEIQQGDE